MLYTCGPSGSWNPAMPSHTLTYPPCGRKFVEQYFPATFFIFWVASFTSINLYDMHEIFTFMLAPLSFFYLLFIFHLYFKNGKTNGFNLPYSVLKHPRCEQNLKLIMSF